MILQTAAGYEIEQTQKLEIDESEIPKAQLLLTKYGPNMVQRTEPTGFYNCHGLTFASRRAWVYGNASDIQHILDDDAYKEVATEFVKAGDTILYFENGVVVHSGIVVEVAETLPGAVKVCSKWAQNAEFVHWGHSTPYTYNVKFFRVKR